MNNLWDADDADAAPRRERKERAGGRLVLVLVLVLVLLAGGGYAGAYALAGDNVPKGTAVAGIDIGGQTRTEAAATLRAGLAATATDPITVVIDDTTTALDPVAAGLDVDYVATVAEAGGGASWRPQRLWDYYTGGDDLAPVVVVDEDALDAAVAALAADVTVAPRDGDVSFVDNRVSTTDPQTGRGLDVDAAAEAVRAAYLTGDPVELTTTATDPDIDGDDVRAAIDDFANPALSGAVTLKFGRSRVRIAPADFADALSFTAVDGALEPAVDSQAIARLVRAASSGDGEPVDASVEIVDGKPKIVKAKPGLTFEAADIGDTFLDALTQPEGERTVRVPGTVDQPDFTTRDAKALGVKEKVSEFTTYYPYAEYRNINIGRAAEIIDGTLLMPGDTFSLNDVVGERTRENGFTEGFIISNGIFAEDLGGGVSQMATTTFNAMFFAGLEDVEHKPHSFYIDRYPVGREATVAWGSVDLRFRNDTDHGVLIDAKVTPATASSQGVVTVRMYSTRVWDITTTTSDRYAFTAPATRVLRTAGCYPNTGYSGFQVDVKRIFKKPGESAVDHTETFHTVYTPSDTVICKPPR